MAETRKCCDVTTKSLTLIFLVFGVISEGVWGQDYTCDYENDTCPTKGDNVCDSSLGSNPSADPSCANSDCLDCNFYCSQFNYDCNACLGTTGCYWCAGDARCYNAPIYNFAFAEGSCSSVDDYLVEGNGSCSPPENFFSDPLYSAQSWVFEQINLLPVWEEGYFGSGIRVRINDDGIDRSVGEFLERYDLNGSCTSAEPVGVDSTHGTGVASVLAAAANNGECAVGIAPESTISSCNIFIPSASDYFDELVEKLDSFDISQNSFGIEACSQHGIEVRRRRLEECPFQRIDDSRVPQSPCDACDFTADTLSEECETAIVTHCEYLYEQDVENCIDFLDLIIGGLCDYNKIPDEVLQNIIKGITDGRDGKGIVYVFSSGNNYEVGDDVNFGGLTNSRLTITVGAVGKDGQHSSYSSPGAALFVSAPGGDGEAVSNHVTAVIGGGCEATAMGTSFSAPVVSGVIALMLEANADLHWRDVQHILATTSQSVEDTDDTTKVTNGAGLVHSNLYGFGIIDAGAAVNASKDWDPVCPEVFLAGDTGLLNHTVLDDPNVPVNSSISISEEVGAGFTVESVVVLLNVRHFSRGDLEVKLVSPSGTASVLHPGKRPETTQDERWKLMTVRNWGEGAVGEWSLVIRDLKDGDAAQCADAEFEGEALGFDISCRFMEINNLCTQAGLNTTAVSDSERDALLAPTHNGLTVVEACCECGGGLETTDFVDELRGWRLVIYGHAGACVEDPSASPTNNTTPEPSAVPSASPTPSPEETPTLRPPTSPQGAGERDDGEKLATIIASVVAILLVGVCVWGMLRNSYQPRHHFGAVSSNGGVDDDFEAPEGSIS